MKRNLAFILLFCCICTSTIAQKVKTTRAEYIEKYAELAVLEMQRTGIPASITLAQACLESDNGNSDLSIASNNHFGIKCHSTWQGKRIYHDDDAKGECFRVYPKVYDSYIDHSNFLKNGQRYAFLFEFDKTDFSSWAYGLKRAGYATNPNYPKLLIKIIEDNQLYKYDTMTSDSFNNKKDTESRENLVVKGDAPQTTVAPPKPWNNEPYSTKNKRNIYKNNGKKFVILSKSETIYKISIVHNIPMWKLYSFNDFKPGQELAEGSIVYLEPKALQAEKTYSTHKVEHGETFYSISQRYGIKVNKLAKMNKAYPEEPIEEGSNIYVRKSLFMTK